MNINQLRFTKYRIKVHRLMFTRPDPEKYMETWLVEPMEPLTFEAEVEDYVDLHYYVKKHLPAYESTQEISSLQVIMFTGYSMEIIE